MSIEINHPTDRQGGVHHTAVAKGTGLIPSIQGKFKPSSYLLTHSTRLSYSSRQPWGALERQQGHCESLEVWQTHRGILPTPEFSPLIHWAQEDPEGLELHVDPVKEPNSVQ